MTSAVLDTNVLASGFTHRAGAPGQLLRLWLADSFDLVISASIFDELVRTFQKPYFRDRLGLSQISANLSLRRATLTAITVTVRGVATHPEDDLIVAAAVSAGAAYLVTGDANLRALRAYQGATIVSPREFLQILSPPGTS